MVYSFQRASVGNYEEWKAVLDELENRRAESGSKGGRLFKSLANPNEVVVLFEWESEEEAREFMEDVLPAKRWENADILSYEMYFLDHVEDFEF